MIMIAYLGHATKVPNGTRHDDSWLWTDDEEDDDDNNRSHIAMC